MWGNLSIYAELTGMTGTRGGIPNPFEVGWENWPGSLATSWFRLEMGLLFQTFLRHFVGLVGCRLSVQPLFPGIKVVGHAQHPGGPGLVVVDGSPA